MATVYSKKLSDGSLSWYTKVKEFIVAKGKYEWVPQHLPTARTKTQAKKLADEVAHERSRLDLGLEGNGLFLGTFGDLCKWSYDVHFKFTRGARSDSSRLRYHGGADIPMVEVKSKKSKKRDQAEEDDVLVDAWESPLGRIPARSVTSDKIEAYLMSLRDKLTVRGTPMSATAINRIRATFSRVFSVAIEHKPRRWAGPNPVRAVKVLKTIRSVQDILTAEEIGPVLEAVPEYWRGCVALALTSALRKGELFGLLKRDVKLEQMMLMVWRSHGNDQTKGGDGTPEPVPIHEGVVPFIREWLQSPGPYVFPDENGERRSEHTKLEEIVRAAMRRAGVVDGYDHKCRRKGCKHREFHPDAGPRKCPKPRPDAPDQLCGYKLWPVGRVRKFVFHGTRHTAASHMLMSGVPIQAVSKILRHKDLNFTMKTYGHLAQGYLGDEMKKLPFPRLSATDATPSHAMTERENQCEAIEHPYPQCTGAEEATISRGALVVPNSQSRKLGTRSRANSSMIPGTYGVEPRGIEPLTYALRTLDGKALQAVTASQVVVNTGLPDVTDSPGSPPFSPAFSSRGALVVPEFHGGHHESPRVQRSGVPGQLTVGARGLWGPLLTIRQVATRLQLTPSCIYREVTLGKLRALRIVNNALRVTEADLAAYIARSQAR